ncbi:type II toxin-antitoxin system RelE/ParE family toxin [Planomonospora sp. ID82291]|uniref:type II toxin-antitoxin system RelE family toxin n=1 Tax=Planomonospora sp. ID82291 TaxID=2738136 RepID=UPI0018C3D81B|nr:type II toxin-antitoxin system RelE/ParE family toxin [Planomonospora sp. ID82291]MBG0813563.1 type II toxin-antitoxin system RelE/ParE family toxin [Planomonospora sp. ID82291]
MSEYERAPFELVVGAAARRAISDKLPPDVAVGAVGAVEFIAGALLENPHRVGKEFHEPLAGVHSARLMREWRILYEVYDEQEPREIHVLDIRHRADAYQRR